MTSMPHKPVVIAGLTGLEAIRGLSFNLFDDPKNGREDVAGADCPETLKSPLWDKPTAESYYFRLILTDLQIEKGDPRYIALCGNDNDQILKDLGAQWTQANPGMDQFIEKLKTIEKQTARLATGEANATDVGKNLTDLLMTYLATAPALAGMAKTLRLKPERKSFWKFFFPTGTSRPESQYVLQRNALIRMLPQTHAEIIEWIDLSPSVLTWYWRLARTFLQPELAKVQRPLNPESSIPQNSAGLESVAAPSDSDDSINDPAEESTDSEIPDWRDTPLPYALSKTPTSPESNGLKHDSTWVEWQLIQMAVALAHGKGVAEGKSEALSDQVRMLTHSIRRFEDMFEKVTANLFQQSDSLIEKLGANQANLLSSPYSIPEETAPIDGKSDTSPNEVSEQKLCAGVSKKTGQPCKNKVVGKNKLCRIHVRKKPN
jgi:hypothetical protein